MIRHGRASPQCQNADRSRSGEVLPDDLFRMLRCVIAPRGEARLALEGGIIESTL